MTICSENSSAIQSICGIKKANRNHRGVFMTVKIQSPRNCAHRVNLQLWIPSQKTFVVLHSVFDTGASKTIINCTLQLFNM